MKMKSILILSFLLSVAVTLDAAPRQSSPVLLELDGVIVALLDSAEGGEATGVVVVEEPTGTFRKKHIGGVKYEDIRVAVGMPLHGSFWDWIRGFTDGNSQRKSGSIILCDFNYNEKARREFSEALITEIGFPDCDGSSKDAAKVTLTIVPTATRLLAGSGKRIVLPPSARQKKWTPANFRLSIDGLDTTRVNKIEAITIKQGIARDNATGDARERQIEPTSLEIPNLKLTVPDQYSRGFFDWHQDFVIKGNNDDSKEREGTLEYLSALNEKLFELRFNHLGIVKVGQSSDPAGPDNIRRVKAEMYCEEIHAKNAGGGTWAYQPGRRGTGLASNEGERTY